MPSCLYTCSRLAAHAVYSYLYILVGLHFYFITFVQEIWTACFFPFHPTSGFTVAKQETIPRAKIIAALEEKNKNKARLARNHEQNRMSLLQYDLQIEQLDQPWSKYQSI